MISKRKKSKRKPLKRKPLKRKPLKRKPLKRKIFRRKLSKIVLARQRIDEALARTEYVLASFGIDSQKRSHINSDKSIDAEIRISAGSDTHDQYLLLEDAFDTYGLAALNLWQSVGAFFAARIGSKTPMDSREGMAIFGTHPRRLVRLPYSFVSARFAVENIASKFKRSPLWLFVRLRWHERGARPKWGR